jgi:NAD(P)-dependent dehydrogenase (short-subunit alcohol dehydrogenase family)
MKTVLITGSTRGIGLGLADSFLSLDCEVTISGRTTARVEEVVASLASEYEPERVFGHPCDVTRLGDVQALWDNAQSQFSRIDIWINNAGISHPRLDFWDHAPERIQDVVNTNLVGAMYGSRVALRGMLEQGFGALYNMEGLGSDGRQVPGMTLYSTTKYGLAYLTDALAQETRGTPVLVCALSPGMVVTDMLTNEEVRSTEDWEAAKRIFNILGDRVEVVTPWLARKVLTNERTGARIKWLTRGKITARFLAAPFRKRDLFA